MNIVKAVVYTSVACFTISIISLVLAGPLYDTLDAFGVVVSDIGIGNVTSFWNSFEAIFKLGFWLFGILGILGALLWLLMRAQQRDYVTEGRVTYK